MTVATIKSFIQAKNATITGLSVGVCPVNWPQSEIPSFPYQLTRKDAGTSRKVAGKTFGRDTWKLYLFLAKQHQETYTQAINDADTYIQRFRDIYTDPANFTLSYTPTIVQVLSNEPDAIKDTGLTEIDYFQQLYYGVIFDLIIQEQEI